MSEKAIQAALRKQFNSRLHGPEGGVLIFENELPKMAKEIADAVLSSTAGQEWRDTSVLQDDLRDMLRALGLPDGARPQSPHEIFRECIEAVKALKARESAEKSALQQAIDSGASDEM